MFEKKFSELLWIYPFHGINMTPVAQSVEHRAAMRAGGHKFDSGRTTTHGLKITEEKVLPL